MRACSLYQCAIVPSLLSDDRAHENESTPKTKRSGVLLALQIVHRYRSKTNVSVDILSTKITTDTNIQKYAFYNFTKRRLLYTACSACSISAIISFTFSNPTDIRIKSGPTPACANCSSVNCRCVVLAGCRQQVRISAT